MLFRIMKPKGNRKELRKNAAVMTAERIKWQLKFTISNCRVLVTHKTGIRQWMYNERF